MTYADDAYDRKRENDEFFRTEFSDPDPSYHDVLDESPIFKELWIRMVEAEKRLGKKKP